MQQFCLLSRLSHPPPLPPCLPGCHPPQGSPTRSTLPPCPICRMQLERREQIRRNEEQLLALGLPGAAKEVAGAKCVRRVLVLGCAAVPLRADTNVPLSTACMRTRRGPRKSSAHPR